MLIFDIVCIFMRKINDVHIQKLEKKVRQMIEKEDIQKLSNKHKKMLTHKLKRSGYFLAFTHVVEELEDKKLYLQNLKEVFFKILPHYQKVEIIRQTYFVYFLSKHSYIYESSRNQVVNFLISSTTSKSVYLRENALHTLYALGNVTYVKEAFFQMNYQGINHHHKLLTDGLLKFKGDSKSLSETFIEEFKNYNENYKVACINYFSYQKIDCKEFIYSLLSKETEEKEVRIACIRYFSNILYEPVLPLLYKLMEDDKENWEYAAITANTLKKYTSSKTNSYLENALKSHNWYVRNNAAASLIEITKKEKLEKMIQNLEDRYAIDALNYQLSLQEKRGEVAC